MSQGLLISENSLGYTTIRLHYSAQPDKDITNTDPGLRARAQEWLQNAQRITADPHRWGQEFEINWWITLGARVYPEFQESLHAPMSLLPNPRKVLYRAWDFGWHTPACLIASVDRKDRLLILREVVGHECSTRDFAQNVLSRCAEWYPYHGPGYQDFADPAGQHIKSMDSEKSEKRDIEVLNTLGIYPTWEYGWSRKDGRALVHQLLVLRTDSTPGIFVDPTRCPTLLQGFLGKFVYPETSGGKIKDEPDESNHPWADIQAALRYLCTGLYSALGLRRFRYQQIIKSDSPMYHGYGTPIRETDVTRVR